VKTPGQLVEVLGTSFNVNAYFDEPAEATTLLSGSVKVSGVNITGSGILKPGQQARTAATLSVLNVDTDLYTDWKDGYFRFSRENIQSIMRKISRWYDVDIRYEGQITREFFIGTMQRPDDLREVLDALKLTGLINYKIQGKNVTITP
jgi:ferric-dicitrate binding protein FerR (iron transport regulator)